MIGWLSGTLLSRDAAAGAVVLNVSGVGYELRVSLQTLASLPDVGVDCEIWVHTHVREDQLDLFGFDTQLERQMFRLLTSVPKVGPRNALGVLGGFPLPDLVTLITERDPKGLQKIPGIGKRTSEQIVLSLADKLAWLEEALGVSDVDESKSGSDSGGISAIEDEAQQTLVAWGWKPKPAEKAIATALKKAEQLDLPLEDLLRRAMKELTETK